MKYRLERGDERVELVRFGRVVTLTHGDGRSEDHGHFDDAAAEQAFGVMLDGLFEQGFVESAETTAERERVRGQQAAQAARRARHEAMASAADPRAALRDAAGAWFADADAADVSALLGFVTRIDEPDEQGFRVRLSTGGALAWAVGDDAPRDTASATVLGEPGSLGASLDSLWLYADARELEAEVHSVYFCVSGDAGPPEPPDDLGDAEWFLQTWPQEKYFFTRASAPWVAHAWELDGGLVEDGRAPAQVLVSTLLEVLRDAAQGTSEKQ